MHTLTQQTLNHSHLFDQCSMASERKAMAVIILLDGNQDTKIVNLHLWKLNSNRIGALITLVASNPRSSEEYRSRLDHIHHLDHIAIEVHDCMDESCVCRN